MTAQNDYLKDPQAFYGSPEKVCYMRRENGGSWGYTGRDFLDLSLGQAEIAEEMFLSCEGQEPESWLDEQFRIGELAVCKECGKIYQGYGVSACPYCGEQKNVEKMEDETMCYEEFVTRVREGLEQHLGGGWTVETKEVRKNNGAVLMGVYIKRENGVSPIVYLEPLYQMFKEKGGNAGAFETVLGKLAEIFQADQKPEVLQITERFMDFSWIKERVIFKLIGQKGNEELLREVPHVLYLDLAIVFEVYLAKKEGEAYTALIKHQSLAAWGIQQGELYELAKKNTPVLQPKVFSGLLPFIIGQTSGDTLPDDFLYILTNRSGIHGAAVLLYDGVLGEIAEELETDLIVIPSSVHEVLITRCLPGMEPGKLGELVRDINVSQVEKEDWLSDHVYVYIRKEAKLEAA